MGLPTKADRAAKSILPKTYDRTNNVIRWQSGRIEGTDYALRKDGSAVRVSPRIPTKKERRREKTDLSKRPGGFRFLCICRANTYHFPSHHRIKPKGYEKMVIVETYQCSACGKHVEKDLVDQAILEAREREKKEAMEAAPAPSPASNIFLHDEIGAGTMVWSPPPTPKPGAIKRLFNRLLS